MSFSHCPDKHLLWGPGWGLSWWRNGSLVGAGGWLVFGSLCGLVFGQIPLQSPSGNWGLQIDFSLSVKRQGGEGTARLSAHMESWAWADLLHSMAGIKQELLIEHSGLCLARPNLSHPHIKHPKSHTLVFDGFACAVPLVWNLLACLVHSSHPQTPPS